VTSDETKQSEKVRTFVAINLPADVRKRIAEIQRELKSLCAHESVRWALPEQIHLTLKFLGGVDSDSLGDLKAAIKLACGKTKPFELKAYSLGCFPNTRWPRVIWIGLTGELEILTPLQTRIEAATKSWREPEAREFHPHLTIGRVKHLKPRELQTICKAMESQAKTNFGSWRVEQIDLMQSKLSPRGATYHCLARFNLMWSEI
jgi:2'-5' RNA ligase